MKTFVSISASYRHFRLLDKWRRGFVCFILFIAGPVFAKEEIKDLFQQQEYQVIIDQYGPKYGRLNFEQLVMLSESYKKVGNLERQIKILKILDSKKPKYYKIHLAIAEASKEWAYQAIKEGKEYEQYSSALDDTIQFYRSTIRLKPEMKKSYVELMGIYQDQENIQEGLGLTNEMLKKFGEQSDIVFYQCEWSSKYGLVGQTKESCEKAMELAPKDPRPRIYEAKAYKDSGDLTVYEDKIFELYREFPSNETVIDLAGAIYIENNDFINAEKVLEKNKDGHIEASRMNYVKSLYENEKYNEASDYFIKSCGEMNLKRREYVRYFESCLRRLEQNKKTDLALKYRRNINECQATPVKLATFRKVNSSHFSEGYRLPANARNIQGDTLADKRANYEKSRKQASTYKTTNSSQKSKTSSSTNKGK